MRLLNLLLLLPIISIISCTLTVDKLQCLADKQNEWKKNEIYNEVRSELNSTFQVWLNNDVASIRYYKKTVWKIDEAIFFNNSQTAAILLVLDQDTSRSSKMDDIHMIYSKKEGLKWEFFYKSMPSFSVERYYTGKKNPEEPYTFKELSDLAKIKLIESGYFMKRNCEINDSYIDNWYSKELEEKNIEFLNEK